MSEYSLRPATIADLADVVRLRRRMFESMCACPDEGRVTDTAAPSTGSGQALDAADVACMDYFAQTIPAGVYRGWVAETPDSRVVASGGCIIDQHPPGPHNPTGRIGYLMNLYVEPAYRGRGLARRIMTVILDHLRAEGMRVLALHATEMGRPLYESLGFAASNEMRLRW